VESSTERKVKWLIEHVARLAFGFRAMATSSQSWKASAKMIFSTRFTSLRTSKARQLVLSFVLVPIATSRHTCFLVVVVVVAAAAAAACQQ